MVKKRRGRGKKSEDSRYEDGKGGELPWQGAD